MLKKIKMIEEMSLLLDKMDNPAVLEAEVIHWGAPIPSFGKLTSAKLATVGLNPSNREFVDGEGKELEGAYRRFHTLKSLGIERWNDIKDDQLDSIVEVCFEYFSRNPYDSWFKKLDNLISGAGISYYFPSANACHLDLIPFATFKKWTDLSPSIKNGLLEISSDFLGGLLKNSNIEIIILNGQTVVDNLERMSGVQLTKQKKENWKLPRINSGGVIGYSYRGEVRRIGHIELGRSIQVLGYNHNIQSSFGVTKNVQLNIRNWISKELNKLNETRRSKVI